MTDKKILEKLTKEQLIDHIQYLESEANFLARHVRETAWNRSVINEDIDTQLLEKALEEHDFDLPDELEENSRISSEEFFGACVAYQTCNIIIDRVDVLTDRNKNISEERIQKYLKQNKGESND